MDVKLFVILGCVCVCDICLYKENEISLFIEQINNRITTLINVVVTFGKVYDGLFSVFVLLIIITVGIGWLVDS